MLLLTIIWFYGLLHLKANGSYSVWNGMILFYCFFWTNELIFDRFFLPIAVAAFLYHMNWLRWIPVMDFRKLKA